MGADLSTHPSGQRPRFPTLGSGIQKRQQQHQQHQRQQQLSKDISIESNLSETPEVNYPPSGLSKPIGSVSGPTAAPQKGNQQQVNYPVSIPREIVIVSRGVTEEDTKRFTFPPPFKPLIPIGHETVSPNVHTIDAGPLVHIGSLLQSELKRKSDFICGQQQTLGLIVKDIDAYAVYLNNGPIFDRHKRFSKCVDNFSKLGEINTLIDKISKDLENLAVKLTAINNYLPEQSRLGEGPFEQQPPLTPTSSILSSDSREHLKNPE